jgi:hypothetical protein
MSCEARSPDTSELRRVPAPQNIGAPGPILGEVQRSEETMSERSLFPLLAAQ